MGMTVRKLGLLFILLDNLFVPVNLGFDFRVHYILYFLFIFYYVFTYRTIKLRAAYLINLVILLFIFSLAPIMKGTGFLEFTKQLLLLSFNLIFCFLLMNSYQFDVKKIFIDYIHLVYIAAIVGIIQILSQIAGFKYGADYSYLGFDMQHFNMQNWKIQSWFQEPSFLAIAFTPAAFVGIARLFNLTEMVSIRKTVVIITVLILSQSSVGLIGLLISLFIVITTRYSILRSPIFITSSLTILILVGIAFYSIPQVKVRADDTARLFFDKHVSAEDIEGANLSTYSMYSNFKIVQASFLDNPILGAGLGTYESIYFRYINVVLPPNNITKNYALNERDANSMLLRMLAELGLFGLLVLGWFLFSNRIGVDIKKHNQLQIDYWIINSAVFVLFCIRLLRQGHYTMLGFMLFVLIYFYSKKQFDTSRTEANINV